MNRLWESVATISGDGVRNGERLARISQVILDLEKERADLVKNTEAERLKGVNEALDDFMKDMDAKRKPFEDYFKNVQERFATPQEKLAADLAELKAAYEKGVKGLDKPEYERLKGKMQEEFDIGQRTDPQSRTAQTAAAMSDNMSIAAMQRGRVDLSDSKKQVDLAKTQVEIARLQLAENKKTNTALAEVGTVR